ncbi:MAG: SCO1664 family protein [Candidatus Nanopelagicales bacterium]
MVTAAEVPGWTVLGQLSDASNATLLVEVDGVRHVYKPVAGERPLWDFPDGTLGRREVAASAVADLLGWPVVPPTRWVEEAPYGPGSLQRWITAPGAGVQIFAAGQVPTGWVPVLRGEDEGDRPVEVAHRDSPAMLRMAVFDLVVNNADRKGGHLYEQADGSVQGVDHGLCFHADPKLRTVLWGFAGREIPEAMRVDLHRLAARWGKSAEGPAGAAGEVREPLPGVTGLSEDEIEALSRRVQALVDDPVLPPPVAGTRAIPWPPL